jgi:hypothetical protein
VTAGEDGESTATEGRTRAGRARPPMGAISRGAAAPELAGDGGEGAASSRGGAGGGWRGEEEAAAGAEGGQGRRRPARVEQGRAEPTVQEGSAGAQPRRPARRRQPAAQWKQRKVAAAAVGERREKKLALYHIGNPDPNRGWVMYYRLE